ncbi:hypothetical protein BDN67DRAFT_980965 [Paxillus ammoniavirescens]|nr:hypothetical protein BDN67DRAFT_980965 [Paxillus ammoniavirescens]
MARVSPTLHFINHPRRTNHPHNVKTFGTSIITHTLLKQAPNTPEQLQKTLKIGEEFEGWASPHHCLQASFLGQQASEVKPIPQILLQFLVPPTSSFTMKFTQEGGQAVDEMFGVLGGMGKQVGCCAAVWCLREGDGPFGAIGGRRGPFGVLVGPGSGCVVFGPPDVLVGLRESGQAVWCVHGARGRGPSGMDVRLGAAGGSVGGHLACLWQLAVLFWWPSGVVMCIQHAHEPWGWDWAMSCPFGVLEGLREGWAMWCQRRVDVARLACSWAQGEWARRSGAIWHAREPQGQRPVWYTREPWGRDCVVSWPFCILVGLGVSGCVLGGPYGPFRMSVNLRMGRFGTVWGVDALGCAVSSVAALFGVRILTF